MLLSVGGYIYLYTRIERKSDSIQAIVVEIENEKKSQENILGLKRSIVLTEQKNEILNSNFVTEDKVVDFIESVESVAQETNVEVEIFSIQQGEQIGKQGLYVSLDAKGDFENVTQFMLLMENMPYYLVINSVILNTQKNNPVSVNSDPKVVKTVVTQKPQWNAKIDFVLVSYRKE